MHIHKSRATKMKTTLEKIAIMQAFEDGKSIKCSYGNVSWSYVSNPQWNWEQADYRVKPETLEDAASKYCAYWEVAELEKTAIKNTFKSGAKWQKEQSE